MEYTYTVRKTSNPPPLSDDFDGASWAQAECGTVANFRTESSAHRPLTRFRVLHDNAHVFVRFQVADRFVRSVQTATHGSVCKDSCTEFFVRPKPDKGYFNFEVNAGGTMLLYYIEDPTRTGDTLKKREIVAASWMQRIVIWHSLPSVVEPEITVPTNWGNGWIIPVELLEAYVGPLGTLSGQTWRANFYKCAGDTSQPHWGAWAPVPKLNFHLPECFGFLPMA